MKSYRILVLAGITLAAACSKGDVLSPIANKQSSATAGANGGLVSNAHRYRAQTYTHASNRSGVATLSARALLAKNGNTTLEVTTGTLGASTAPGNISKLQLKGFATNGLLQTTTNLNGLSGGRQLLNVGGRAPRSTIQIQGNVRDIDPKRTDVVTITERVNRLPDLTIQHLSAPSETRPSTQFMVVADLAELNGDIGATANCVLYVDDVFAGRSVGVWVAEHDVVNCAFTASIADVGSHTLKVAAEAVSPADWDLANNSASTTITVTSPQRPLTGQAGVYDYRYRNQWKYSGDWFNSSYYNERYSWADSSGYVEDNRQVYLSAYTPDAITLPVSAASFSYTTNDVTASPLSAADLVYSYINQDGTGCQYNYSWYSNRYLQICNNGPWGSYVYAGHYAGRAIYYSGGFQDYRNDLGDGNYHNEWAYTYNYWYYYYNNDLSEIPAFGQTTQFNMSVTGANGMTYTANPLVDFAGPNGYSYEYSQPSQNYCYPYSDGIYTSNYCQSYIYEYRYRQAWTNF